MDLTTEIELLFSLLEDGDCAKGTSRSSDGDAEDVCSTHSIYLLEVDSKQKCTKRKARPKPCNTNERERWRHQHLNDAFEILSKLLPVYPITKKMKKREILQKSIKYIKVLQTLLDGATENRDQDSLISTTSETPLRPENEHPIVSVSSDQPTTATEDIFSVTQLADNDDLTGFDPVEWDLSMMNFEYLL